jgi:hypothetical protein
MTKSGYSRQCHGGKEIPVLIGYLYFQGKEIGLSSREKTGIIYMLSIKENSIAIRPLKRKKEISI